MKQIKLTLVALLVAVFSFYSCQDETVDSQNTTTESAAITNALNALQEHFDDQGNLQNGQNPTNNIIFDFCFDFVYPITLSYNTSTEVTVDDFDGLVDILINTTDTLYINGIAFPFQVESFNESTGAFEILTVQNEADFTQLLDTCSIDENGQVDDCIFCTLEYDPVCVSMLDSAGQSFTFSFTNMCNAECAGFTQADIINCDNSNFNTGNLLTECFDYIYPIEIELASGTVIQINNDDELALALYTNYQFNFVYPFDIEEQSGGQTYIRTINSNQELTQVLQFCDGSCGIFNLSVTIGNCLSPTMYQITVDFDHANYDSPNFIITLNNGTTGTYNISDLPIQLDVERQLGGSNVLMISSTSSCNNGYVVSEISWQEPDC